MKVTSISLGETTSVYDIGTPSRDYIMSNGAISHNTMDMYNPLAVGGGKGLFFASSSIVMGTSKAENKDTDGEISGAIITANTKKSRFARENSKLKFLIKYEGGIHPYYGMLDDAIDGGYVIKPTMGFYSRPSVTDDKKWREKAIWENSPEFWAPILTQTDFPDYIAKKYTFEQSSIVDEDFEIGDIVYKVDKATGEVFDKPEGGVQITEKEL